MIDVDEYYQSWCDDEGDPYVKMPGPFGTEIRVFNPSVEWHRLKWHRDTESRTIKVLKSCPGWFFQLDEKLPMALQEGMEFEIPYGCYHRAINKEASSPLEIQIIRKPLT